MINRVAVRQHDPTFTVKFTNRGDNDETNVKVDVARHAAAGTPIRRPRRSRQTKARRQPRP